MMTVCDEGVVGAPSGTFGESLRRFRRAAGLTQEELAERSGISPRSISGLERGEGATPRRDTLALLEQALGLEGDNRDSFEALVVRQPRTVPEQLSTLPGGDAPRPNFIRRSLTRFIGRERQLGDLGPHVLSAPLLTLIGAGGVGKTRLAQELVRLHGDSFADGTWFVELAEVVDPADVAQTVAAALGVRDVRGRNATDALPEHLQAKDVLLVLDNCEHLIDACAALARELLAACPRLHILATSREPLGLNGEIVRRVPPLDLPDARSVRAANEVMAAASVELFVDRARAANPSFSVTDENAAAIAQVCVAVDGIPLALELAAARTRVLTVAEVARRLHQDLRVLAGGGRDMPARHQSIRATIDWSYDLLDATEQMLLRRLSAFAGGWTLQMAEDLCSGAGVERTGVLDVLSQLVDKSLVVVDTDRPVARYRLSEPVRQHARAVLDLARFAGRSPAMPRTVRRAPRSAARSLNAPHRVFSASHCALYSGSPSAQCTGT